MKKIIISWLFCLVAVCMFGQDACIYFREQKISYKVSATKMLVKLKKSDITGIKKVLQNPIVSNPEKIYDMGDGIFLIEMQHTDMSKENTRTLQRQLSSREDVIYTSPVFGNDALGSGYTNEVIVMLKSKDDYPILQKYAGVYHIEDIRTEKYLSPETYVLTLPHNSEKDAMQTALELHETDLFEYAEPNVLHLFPFASNDTYFPNQWNLKNTGQSGGTAGIDINVEWAWTFTSGGSSDIKIAIIDTGVDLNHPDLVNNLLPGYDAFTHSSNGGAPTNLTEGDFPHGTKCAGVAAAQGNNSKGIAGVAYGCKIIPITAGEKNSISVTAAAEGINWAWHNGADVISMSYGDYSIPLTEALAIDSATTYGRNGKGCVLVACAHNHQQANVTFPASSDKVIAVGALLNNGYRKIESNHGPDLNVMAPGEGIYTTCITGTGENTVIDDGANGVYTSDFSATSAATPHVAGVAALVLSTNSTLTAKGVRDIIDMTARKLNNYDFQTMSEHPNGTWNNEVGYGLLDAQAAVQAAICMSSMSNQTMSSNKFIRSCNNSFDIPTVTVTNNAKLTIKAYETTISGEFEVQSGSQFEIR
jgi:subtilisin family serine protease